MEIIEYQGEAAAKILGKRKFEIEPQIRETVREIVNEVRNKGDQALKKYTAKFDKVEIEDFKVSEAELDQGYKKTETEFKKSLQKAVENVKEFHEKQLRQDWFSSKKDKMTGQLFRPLQRVGAYVPGGRAAYPSSVIMTVVPALAAGVEEIVVVTPPDTEGNINPYTLIALKETGVKEIYKVGGAQAVAALAAGTSTIKPVHKIVGPGNIYVTTAKKMVYGEVDIDMLAGPSEVMILADENANPGFIAADLLSQAEHDPRAIPILVTTSTSLAEAAAAEVEKQMSDLDKKEIAEESWKNNGKIIIVENIETGMEVVNEFAPEHFELVVKEPFSYLDQLQNAGAVFIGEYSSEPLGDYIAGPNHVLPTAGTAKFSSPLNTDDFIKKTSLIYFQKEGLKDVEADIRKIAQLEGLDAHAGAVAKRFMEESD